MTAPTTSPPVPWPGRPAAPWPGHPPVAARPAAALLGAAHRLTDLAAEVRRYAAALTAAAAASSWRSIAATGCRDRLADLALDLLAAAALLDHAAAVVEDHARTAAHRATSLAEAAARVATAGVVGALL